MNINKSNREQVSIRDFIAETGIDINEIKTPFGSIFIMNESGSLNLQELIDEFAEKLKTV